MVFHHLMDQGPSQSHIYITMLYAWLISCSLQVLEMTTSGRSKMSNRLVGVVGSGLLTTQVYPSTILVSVLWPIALPSPPTRFNFCKLVPFILIMAKCYTKFVIEISNSFYSSLGKKNIY